MLRAVSYLVPIPARNQQSAKNGKLQLRWENGTLVLNSRNANYSFGSLHQVWRNALRKTNISPEDKVLVLGGGVGSIPYIVHKEKCVKAHITVVEHDEEILQLGVEHFGFVEDQHTKIVHADAFAFCATSTEQYQLILIDLFTDMEVPEQLRTERFFADLERIKTKRALILLNAMEYDEQSTRHVSAIEQAMKAKWPQVKRTKLNAENTLLSIQFP